MIIVSWNDYAAHKILIRMLIPYPNNLKVMKNIVVPCNFSPVDKEAIRFAVTIAERSKGTVHLLHAIALPVIANPFPSAVASFKYEMKRQLEEMALRELENVLGERETNVTVRHHVKFGSLDASLLNFSEQYSVDLIVIGSHGAQGMREMLVGSNTEKIVRKANVPVMVIKDRLRGAVRKIVFPIPLDMSDLAGIIRGIRGLQSFFDATLHLLWVNTPQNFKTDTVTTAMLKDFASTWQLENTSLHIVSDYDEEEGILGFANYIGAELIAMATHGRTGISHVLHGSLTEDIVNHSDRMMWTYADHSRNPITRADAEASRS